MPKKAFTTRTKSQRETRRSVAQSSTSSYLKLRQQIESMQELHAVALVVMVSLVAAMFMVLAKQKREISELQFQVGFLEERYHTWRDKGMQEIEAKAIQADEDAGTTAQE